MGSRIILFLVSLFVTVCTSLDERPTKRVCNNNETYHKAMGTWIGYHEGSHRYVYQPQTQFDVVEATQHFGERAPHKYCHPTSSNTITDPLWSRSLCAWSWKENFDTQRVPSRLLEAHCQCDKLVVELPEGTAVYECERIYFKVRVLRLDENCKYRSEYEDVAIACTAVNTVYRKPVPLYNVLIHDNKPDSQI